MYTDYFKQAVKNLLQRRLRSWLTMIGIFIGVALVVALVSLGQGMQDAIVGQFAGLGADTITIQAAGGGYGPPGSYQSVTIGEDDLDVVKKVPGVKAAFGRIIGAASAEVNGVIQYGYFATFAEGADEYRLSITVPSEFKAEKGRIIKPTDRHKAVVGNTFATKDIFGEPLVVGDKMILGEENYDIVGILEKTGNPQLDVVVWVSQEDGMELSGKEDVFGLIAAKVDDGADIDEVKENIEKALRKDRKVEEGKEDFVVTTAQETIDSLNEVLGAVKWFLVGIAFISLLVGSVGITNTMYTSVLERTREIGIMKAIGARNWDVLTLFLIESGVIGVIGGLIGISLGLLLSFGTAAIAQAAMGASLIQAHVSLGLLLGALAGSFLVGSLAGITPAYQAAKMKPVEALQHG